MVRSAKAFLTEKREYWIPPNIPKSMMVFPPERFAKSGDIHDKTGKASSAEQAHRESGHKPATLQKRGITGAGPSNNTIKRSLNNHKILVATSIAPAKIEYQEICISSWIKYGFDVVSLNVQDEINLLKPIFSGVEFVEAKRDSRDSTGKPLVYFDDINDCLKRFDYNVYGIMNSDIFIKSDSIGLETLYKMSEKSLVFSSRIDVEDFKNMEGEIYDRGFDCFFMSKDVLEYYPKSEFCIGMPWWDYWIVLISLFSNIPTTRMDIPFGYHKRHDFVWSRDQFVRLGRQFYGFIKVFIGERISSDNALSFSNLFSTLIYDEVFGLDDVRPNNDPVKSEAIYMFYWYLAKFIQVFIDKNVQKYAE